MFSFTVLKNRKCFEKIFSKKLHTQKNGPSGAPRPAGASPWRAKWGTLPKLSIFLSQLKWGPFGEKTNFRKKISQCRKTERGTLWDFPTSILTQNSKKLKGDPLGEIFFRKKGLAVPKKNERGDPLVSPDMVL